MSRTLDVELWTLENWKDLPSRVLEHQQCVGGSPPVQGKPSQIRCDGNIDAPNATFQICDINSTHPSGKELREEFLEKQVTG